MENNSTNQNQSATPTVEHPKTQFPIKVPNLPKFTPQSLKKIGIIAGIVLVFLMLIGFIVSNIRNIFKGPVSQTPLPVATQAVSTPEPVATVSGELSIYDVELNKLKDEINAIDVDQSRLSPPQINFNIRF